MKRTLRPTFLLRCIVLMAIIALVALIAKFASSLHIPMVLFVTLIGIWFIGIEMGVMPTMLEKFLARKAEALENSANSLCFVDLEKERLRDMNEHKKTSSGNPTIR